MHAVLFPPADPAQRDTWRSQLHQWRTIIRDLMGYDGSSYALPAFAWASRTFALGFLMMFDLQFDDPKTGQYRIDEALDEADEPYTGPLFTVEAAENEPFYDLIQSIPIEPTGEKVVSGVIGPR